MKTAIFKLMVMVLVVALFLSMSTNAFAVEALSDNCEEDAFCENISVNNDITPRSTCTTHTWQSKSTLVLYGGTYVSSTVCKSYWKETRTCTKCGTTEFVRYYYVSNDTHASVAYSASCDGRIQTIVYKCKKCAHVMETVHKNCPGAPHSGVCSYLPV